MKNSVSISVRKFIAAGAACVLFVLAPGLPCYQAAAQPYRAQARTGAQAINASAALSGIGALSMQSQALVPSPASAFNAAQALALPITPAIAVQAESPVAAEPVGQEQAAESMGATVRARPSRAAREARNAAGNADIAARVGELSEVAGQIAKQAVSGETSAADHLYEDARTQGGVTTPAVLGARGLLRRGLRPAAKAAASVAALLSLTAPTLAYPPLQQTGKASANLYWFNASLPILIMAILTSGAGLILANLYLAYKDSAGYKHKRLLEETDRKIRYERTWLDNQKQSLLHPLKILWDKRGADRASGVRDLARVIDVVHNDKEVEIVLPVLVSMIKNDPSQDVRYEAVRAVSHMAELRLHAGDKAFIQLVRALENTDSSSGQLLYVNLIQALEELGSSSHASTERHAEAVSALSAIMTGHIDPQVRSYAAEMIGRSLADVKHPSFFMSAAMKAITRSRIILDPDAYVRAQAALSAEFDGYSYSWNTIADDLIGRLVNDKDSVSRRQSALLLYRIGQKLPENSDIVGRVVSHLLERVQRDPSPEVRLRAAECLGRMGKRARSALAGLNAVLITKVEKEKDVLSAIRHAIVDIHRASPQN